MKPISHSKHHHHHGKEKPKRLLFQEEDRLIPVHSNPDPNHNHHRLQIQQMRRELTQALSNIRYIAEHCANQSLIESIRDEWKFIATVIDRLQFVIFLTVTISGSLALLFQVYNFISNTLTLFLFLFRYIIYSD